MSDVEVNQGDVDMDKVERNYAVMRAEMLDSMDLDEGVQNGLCQQSETEDIPLLPLPPTQAAQPAPSTPHGNGDTPAHIDVMEEAARTSGTGAAGGDLEPTDIRIDPSHGASDTQDTQDKVQALFEAIDNRDVATVKSLLASGAPIDHIVDGTTPLHSCMHRYGCQSIESEKEKEIIEAMVTAAKERNVLACLDGAGRTPLCVAIWRISGNLSAVKALVNAGAPIRNLFMGNESVLHVAVRSMHYNMLKYFLDNLDPITLKELNSGNNNGDAPIHIAAIMGKLALFQLLVQKLGTDQVRWRTNKGSTVWHYIAPTRSYDIANNLIQTAFKVDLNVVDVYGTPLERAANLGDMTMTTLLLRNGAKLAVKGEKDTVIKQIASRFNNPLKFFEDLFDECINEKNNTIKVDYKILVSRDMSQIKVLEDFMRFGLSKILKHPTIESLIYFKWRCLLPVFYTIIVTYITFLMSLNIFVITTFSNIDTSNATCNGTQVTFNATETPLSAAETSCAGSCGWLHWTLVVFIYISTAVLITLECCWIYLKKLHHFGRLETWLKLTVLVLALAVPVFLGCYPAPDSMTWQRHAACLALLLAWLQAMLLLSRFPGWGYYVLMLERVAINILKILATTICMVFGFSTCLMIQYQSKPPFDGPVAAFAKTLVMMASEFDYDDLFDKDHDAELKNTKVFVRCLFVVFVIFIAIVLMNFMTGVAVSDVNELNDIGNIRRLENQVQLLSTLEDLGDTVIIFSKWWPKLRSIRFHESMERYLTHPGRSWKVQTRDMSGTGVPVKTIGFITNSEVPPNIRFVGFMTVSELRKAFRLDNPGCFTETFSSELHNAILNVAKKNKQNVDKLDAVYNAVVERSQVNDCVSIASRSRATPLNERLKPIEDAIKELKESMDKVLEVIASSRSPTRGCTISSNPTRKRKNVRRKGKNPSTYLIKPSNY